MRRAFTLVELLVVISIIALLIALLLPSLSRTKESAYRVVCGSQLHQLSLGHQQWATDNDGQYALNTPNDPVRGRGGIWSVWRNVLASDAQTRGWYGNGLLYRDGYIDTGQVSYCPSWTHELYQFHNPTYGWVDDPSAAGRAWIGQSYHYRGTFEFGSAEHQWGTAANLDDNPGSTAILADGFTYISGNTLLPEPAAFYHHTDGYNAAYMDGSVQWVIDIKRDIPATVLSYGSAHTGWAAQEQVWQEFFDRHDN